jgi:hypothetical protein
MWSDGCGIRKLHYDLAVNFRLNDPVLHRPLYFLIFGASSGIEAMEWKFMKL